MNECMYCQLEKSDKAFAYHGLEDHYCIKHKHMPKSKSNPLDFVDDEVDLAHEHDEITREMEEQDRNENI